MKKIAVIYGLLFSIFAFAQKPSTQGTEFWLTFLNNMELTEWSTELELKLIASSQNDAEVTVANLQTGWEDKFEVTAGNIAEYVMPLNQCYLYDNQVVSQRGIYVISTAPISLFASNFSNNSYDASIVLPLTALGTDYVIQIYEDQDNPLIGYYAREVGIVATENNTTVTIIPHAPTIGGNEINTPFQVILNAGEAYEVRSVDMGYEFSGTRISADKPIAVFSGHQCINIPSGRPRCDHIFEQQMPLQMWGRHFALTKTKGREADRIMVTSNSDNNQIQLNGSIVAEINQYQTYSFRLTDESGFLETSEPATVFMYLEGCGSDHGIGDPSSVHISPIEQMIDNLSFATYQTYYSRTHFINIVSTVLGAQEMLLDGVSISSEFMPLKGNDRLRFAQINLPHGTHNLRTAKDGLIGHVYGVGERESYAYTLGSATLNLAADILIDGTPQMEINTDERCYGKTVNFSFEANRAYETVMWDFGDGSSSTQNDVSHSFSDPGDYTVSLILAKDGEADTTTTMIHLVDVIHDTVYATICDNEIYSVGDVNLTASGNVTLTSVDGCDSVVTVFLNINKSYLFSDSVSIPMCSTYLWHGKEYTQTGVYYDSLSTQSGCDSVFELKLTVQPIYETIYEKFCYQPKYSIGEYSFDIPQSEEPYYDYYFEFFDESDCTNKQVTLSISTIATRTREFTRQIDYGESYDFYGQTITEEGTYSKLLSSSDGCDSLIILHLNVSYPKIESINATALCEPANQLSVEISYIGNPDSLRFRYSGRDMAKGLNDTTLFNLSENYIFHHSARAGNYTIYADLYKKGKIITSAQHDFMIPYSANVIEQAWNDVMIVLAHEYNGGYDFQTFQWYKNGEIMDGETGSYIYQALEYGAEYAVMLTEKNGLQLMSCPRVATMHDEAFIYPTIIPRGQLMNCRSSARGVMSVFDIVGNVLSIQEVSIGDFQYSLPQKQGIYLVRIEFVDSDKSCQYKVIVQ